MAMASPRFPLLQHHRPGQESVNQYHDELQAFGDVWLLGKYYSPSTSSGLQALKDDIRSRLLMTYRKNFTSIGGTGPSSDRGWGCMLRCGQMLLGHALICMWLTRDWVWSPNEENDAIYYKLLSQFMDHKNGIYSVHQIAQMGVSEGKNVGEWFGPNTVAQVIRKLSFFDTWSDYVVHISMDNTIVLEDLHTVCQSQHYRDYQRSLSSSSVDPDVESQPTGDCQDDMPKPWRPLLLFIPLRLGLTEINETYIPAIKACFHMPQTVGLIGGRPNSAYYFMGYQSNFLLYFDPHDTKPSVESAYDDSSYHSEFAKRMPFSALDPSIAIAFLIKNEEELSTWCEQVRKSVICTNKQTLFEIVQSRPTHWPPLQLYAQMPGEEASKRQEPFTEVQIDDADEGFVLLD